MIRCCNPDCLYPEIDPARDKFWQRVQGWEQAREQGGTNHIALRETVELYMCQVCMTRERNGIAKGQLTFG